MAARDVIAALRQVWDSCTEPQWRGGEELQLAVAERIAFERLRELQVGDIYVSFADPGLQLAFDSNQHGAADRGTIITMRVPRTLDSLVVAKDLSDLLALPEALTREPAAYVFLATQAQGGFFGHVQSDDLSPATPLVRRYHEAIRLWRVLAQQAQHVDEVGALLFFGIRRTEITPGFAVKDLVEDFTVQAIHEFVANSDRTATRKEIFASVLSDFLRDQDSATAFPSILRGSDRFARRLKEGLAIYLAEHSPEKLAEEAKNAALSLSEKLEGIITGLETKSLAIPVALLLAVKDVEPGAGATALNLILVIAALTYASTMTLVHRSQMALLDLLRTTILSAEKEFRSKGLDESNPVLDTSFKSLKRRSAAAGTGSRLMCVASWAPLICVIGAVWFGTPKSTATASRLAPSETAPSGAKPNASPAPAPVQQSNAPNRNAVPSLSPARPGEAAGTKSTP